MLLLQRGEQGATFMSLKGFEIMQNIRSFFLAVSAMAVVAVMALFTLTVSLAFAGVLSIILISRAMASRPKPIPVRARQQKPATRVWNDGRGTIIDL